MADDGRGMSRGGEFCECSGALAGVDAKDLALVILHQANQRIIDSAVSDLNLPPEKVFVNLDRYGNTSGASIPLALDEAARAGKIQPGDLVVDPFAGHGPTLLEARAMGRRSIGWDVDAECVAESSRRLE